MRACKSCHVVSEEEVCPKCGTGTSQYWSGYLGIINPEESEIAKKLEITEAGQFALKVR